MAPYLLMPKASFRNVMGVGTPERVMTSMDRTWVLRFGRLRDQGLGEVGAGGDPAK